MLNVDILIVIMLRGMLLITPLILAVLNVAMLNVIFLLYRLSLY
jgi:hypothetical protein